MFFNFLMQMLSPTLNYSLTTCLHGGKAACKRSMAWLQQDLLSTRCEMKKIPLLRRQKKAGKSPLWGKLFSKRNANRRTKIGECTEPLPCMAIPKGDGHRPKCWDALKPSTSRESGFLPSAQKRGISGKKKEGHTSTNRAKSVFLSLSPP